MNMRMMEENKAKDLRFTEAVDLKIGRAHVKSSKAEIEKLLESGSAREILS
jgi:hypothetical protein